MLEVACGEQTVGRTQLCDSFSKFKISGSYIKFPKTQDVHWPAKQMKIWIEWSGWSLRQRTTIHEVAGMLRVSFGLVKSILRDVLKMCQTATKFKPHPICEEQKENCVSMFQDLQDSLRNTSDLMPCEFFLFTKLKVVLIVWRCGDITMIQGKSRDGLGKFQRTSQCFR